MTIQRIEFIGLPLDTGASIEDVCELLRTPGRVRMATFVNPQAWALKGRHAIFVPALQAMTLVLPDGEGVARACRMITGLPCTRMSFDMTSLADPFFRAASDARLPIMLVGGKPGVDEAVHEKLQIAYPSLTIAATTHGYNDFGPKIELIMSKRPAAVVVGMGSPRQEEFLLALRDAGYDGLAITCGGFFDQYLEAADYYPVWIDRANLRFAWRLYKEPQRLWKRYLIDYHFFVWPALAELAQKFTRRRTHT